MLDIFGLQCCLSLIELLMGVGLSENRKLARPLILDCCTHSDG